MIFGLLIAPKPELTQVPAPQPPPKVGPANPPSPMVRTEGPSPQAAVESNSVGDQSGIVTQTKATSPSQPKTFPQSPAEKAAKYRDATKAKAILLKEAKLVGLDDKTAMIAIGGVSHEIGIGEKQVFNLEDKGWFSSTHIQPEIELLSTNLDTAQATFRCGDFDLVLTMSFDKPPPAPVHEREASSRQQPVAPVAGERFGRVSGEIQRRMTDSFNQIDAELENRRREREEREAAELAEKLRLQEGLVVSQVSEHIDEYGYRHVTFVLQNRNKLNCESVFFNVVWSTTRNKVISSHEGYAQNIPAKGKQTIKVMPPAIETGNAKYKIEVEITNAVFH